MRIAYVTSYNPEDLGKVNGAGWYVARALARQSVTLRYINTQDTPAILLLRGVLKASARLLERVFGQGFNHERGRLLSHAYALVAAQRLRRMDVDAVVSPICPGSPPTAYLDTDLPIAIWTDATFATLLRAYPSYRRLSAGTVRAGLANERAALERCRLAIFSSDWAARMAAEHYGLTPAGVAVVPFGPYLPVPGADDVQAMISSRPRDACRLLFLGRDWRRKGGDTALQVATLLHDAGLPVELTVVGSRPPGPAALPPWVRTIGVVNKRTPQGIALLQHLLATSHFLLVPTHADCAPAAVREACAFGLPCLTSDVGGLPTLVRNGRNGYTFPFDAPPEAYADAIAEAYGDGRRYQELARGAWGEYQARLNWDVAGREVKRLLSEVVATHQRTTIRPARAAGSATT
jgi:glycosyltransferase involved in cell wall biosynthesis